MVAMCGLENKKHTPGQTDTCPQMDISLFIVHYL